MSLDVPSTTRATLEVLDTLLTHLRPYQWHTFDIVVACTAIWTFLRWFCATNQRPCITQLRGPPSESLLYGVGKHVYDIYDSGSIYEAWAQEHGPVYTIPWTLGSKKLVLCDPKAIAHFYSKDTWTYIHTPSIRKALAISTGKGVLWAHGENHKRKRKSLALPFTIAAIRQLTPIFYDSAYKAKGAWDLLIESSGEESTVIDVQKWMNHISLDTMGLAGFSHNFGGLEGKHAQVTEVFDAFSSSPRTTPLDRDIFLLSQAFPFLLSVPTPRGMLLQKLDSAVREISDVLLPGTQKELEMNVPKGKEDRSIIGVLIKSANEDSEYHLTKDDVISQIKVLLIAGYETTAISLCWALLELSRNPDVQTNLRNELPKHGTDPTYDQLTNGLPYLDAVVHEILRVHVPVPEITRIAIKDDVVPLSEPIRTKSGELVDSVAVTKDTLVTISMECINRSVALWGEDAKTFRPSRWLKDEHGQDGIPAKAKEIQGHRHLLTFVGGPRTCLGKNFAVTEFKAVLSVLVKNFVFELRDGVDTKIETGKGVLTRPKIAGEVGCKLPLRVRPYVA